MNPNRSKRAKPFLKWAGGKAQLLSPISQVIYSKLNDTKSLTYIEPFVGSGAVLFWFLQNFPSTQNAIINDINFDLINLFKIVKHEPRKLITELSKIQSEYFSYQEEESKKSFFLEKKEQFNTCQKSLVARASTMIFLNKTCYNGLYRVNSKGKFNVPFGKCKKPKICDTETLMMANQLLQKVNILHGDFSQTLKYAETKNTFFYIDPPYKPISKSSSFNSYSSFSFDDNEQTRLKDFCLKIDDLGYKFLLSNSDPKNKEPNNHFFEELYSNFQIERVNAIRKINSNSKKRGKINELLISNF